MIHAAREAQQASCTGSAHLSICLSALPSPRAKTVALLLFGQQSCGRTTNQEEGKSHPRLLFGLLPACLPGVAQLCIWRPSPAKVGRRRRCESITLAKLTLTFVQSRRRANQDHNQLFHIKAGNKKKRDQGFFCISRARSGLRDVIQPLFYCAVHTAAKSQRSNWASESQPHSSTCDFWIAADAL